jgi:hypothetical protein
MSQFRKPGQEETPMAVVVVEEVPGGNQSIYEGVGARVMPDGRLPEGCAVHIAGPTDGGWRVISVWDTEEQYQQFANEKLIPAFQEVAGEEGPTPRIEAHPVHTHFTA